MYFDVWNSHWVSEYLYSYSNLDASTGDYQEEEGYYQAEEEENLENYQGKLILLQSAKLLWGKAPDSYLS